MRRKSRQRFGLERERAKVRCRRGNKEKRLSVIKMLGNVCSRCGESDTEVIQVDHIHGQGYTELQRGYRSTKGWWCGYRDHKHFGKKYLLDNYQNLCANCHMRKTREEGDHRGKWGYVGYEKPWLDEALKEVDQESSQVAFCWWED